MVTYLLLVAGAIFLIAKFISNYNSTVKTINGTDALEMHTNQVAKFVDVRTPAEIAQGKLKGAIEANVTSMMFKKEIANLDRSQPYVVYCRSGMRSARACKIMEKEGFTDLTNVKGGYMGMN